MVGTAFAVAGALATLPFVVASDRPGNNALMLIPAAVLAALLVAPPLWRLLVVGRTENWRGPVAGGLVGLLAHPLMWMIISLRVGAEMGSDVATVVSGSLLGGAFFGLFGMVVYGPLTVPLAGLVGWLLGRSTTLRGLLKSEATGPDTPDYP